LRSYCPKYCAPTKPLFTELPRREQRVEKLLRAPFSLWFRG
jgi:hypothetical protein